MKKTLLAIGNRTRACGAQR